jgi:nitrite reductase (NO-forming)
VTGRRCRRRAISPGSPRPSQLVAVFFAAALLMLLAAAVAGVASAVTGRPWLRWLALHLALLGGVSQLVLGAGQFFTCAFLATDPPSRRLVRAQLVSWNAGTVGVAIGVPTGVGGLADAGAALVAAGLVLFALALRGMQRTSLQRAPWAVRWYMACAACLALGALVGALLARGTVWSHGSLLGAHLALNLGGWLGMAIVGTLHTFFPSLTQTRLRHAQLQAPTFWLWLLGVALLAGGAAGGSQVVVAAGWLGLALAASGLGINLIASLRGADASLTLPARLIALAQCFLVAALIIAFAATVRDGFGAAFVGQARGALAALLIAGWIGLTVTGALLHLLAVVARVRHFALAMPTARPLRDRVLSGAAALAIAALGLSHGAGLDELGRPAAVALLAVAAALGAQLLPLAYRALRPSRGARMRTASSAGQPRSTRPSRAWRS